MHRGIVAIATILSAIGGFILGRIFERSRIVRQLEETKKQILKLSNKSSKIEDRFQNLVHACVLYEMILDKAKNNDRENIQNIINDFQPLDKLLKENITSIERAKIKVEMKLNKQKIKNRIEKEIKNKDE